MIMVSRYLRWFSPVVAAVAAFGIVTLFSVDALAQDGPSDRSAPAARLAADGSACENDTVISNYSAKADLVADCEILWAVRSHLVASAGGSSFLNWAEDVLLSDWTGVTVENNRVRELNLYERELSGSIPKELGSLTELRRLSLTRNELSGEIPKEIGNLRQLEDLWLGGNQLSGEIPIELSNLTQLKSLYLYDNQLSGKIPKELAKLANLDTLSLHKNQLSGEIPRELLELTSLRTLSLSGNRLSGEIPKELASLSNLRHLDIAHNNLNGEIPKELFGLTNLRVLNLSRSGLSGAIPNGLNRLTYLEHLDLSANRLSGEIPRGLNNLTRLRYFYLNNNELSGEIPVELGRLTNLAVLKLNHNAISGAIPLELTQLRNIRVLNLSDNKLSGVIPGNFKYLASMRRLHTFDNPDLRLPDSLGSLPVFVTEPTIRVADSTKSVELIADDADYDRLTWKVTGGADRDLFVLSVDQDQIYSSDSSDSSDVKAVLNFKIPPELDHPRDQGSDNIYEVEVTVHDWGVSTTRLFEVLVTNVLEPPAAVNLLNVASKGSGSLSVSWEPLADNSSVVTHFEAQYRIVRQEYDNVRDRAANLERILVSGVYLWVGDWVTMEPVPSSSSRVIVTDLVPSTEYQVRVRAVNGVGASAWSNARAAVIGAANSSPAITAAGDVPVGAVRVVVIRVLENFAEVQLQASDPEEGELSWEITGGADGGLFDLIVDENNSTKAILQIAVDYEKPEDRRRDNVYKVKVTVTDDAGNTATKTFKVKVSDVPESVPVVPAAPNPPTVVAGGPVSLIVTWTSPDDSGDPDNSGDPDIDWFELQYKTGANDWILMLPDRKSPTDRKPKSVDAPSAQGAAVSGIEISGLEPATSYDVRVRAVNDGGASDWSEPVTAVTDAANAPPVITTRKGIRVMENAAGIDLVATDADGDELTWSITGGADRNLYALTVDKSNSAKARLSFVSAPDFENPADRDGDNVYEVGVTVTDARGASVAESFELSVVNTSEPPGLPIRTTVASTGTDSLEVSWVTPAGADRPAVTSFDVAYRTGSSDWVRLNPGPGSDDSVAIVGLEPSTSYDVRVRAVNNEGVGDWSEPVTAVTETPNSVPAITTGKGIRVLENTAGIDLVAIDADGDELTWSITKGVDRNLFTLTANQSNSAKARLSFVSAPDFENPADRRSDNIYKVGVTVTDARDASVTKTFRIRVADVSEPSEEPAPPTVDSESSESVENPPDTPADPEPEVARFEWSGILTAGKWNRGSPQGASVGYDPPNGRSNGGSLENAAFTYEGVQYTVDRLFTWNASVRLDISPKGHAGPLPDDVVLEIRSRSVARAVFKSRIGNAIQAPPQVDYVWRNLGVDPFVFRMDDQYDVKLYRDGT